VVTLKSIIGLNSSIINQKLRKNVPFDDMKMRIVTFLCKPFEEMWNEKEFEMFGVRANDMYIKFLRIGATCIFHIRC
jgi:hypothetical protein